MTTSALTVHRPRLLVVDDEPSIAELLRIWFEPVGWDVVTAASGPEGVARAAEQAARRGGPRRDAAWVRRARGAAPGPAAAPAASPCCSSTARDSEEDRAAGLAAGADAYLVKPYSLVGARATGCATCVARVA